MIKHGVVGALVIFSALGLGACTGGDSTSVSTDEESRTEASVNNELLTGRLSDSFVGGVNYQTQSQSGVTAPDGSFHFMPGETVTFSLGDVQIGETVPAKNAMTPLDLVPGAQAFTTTAEIERLLNGSPTAEELEDFNGSVNILVFLQAFDSDGNPDNGITIPAGIDALLDDAEIDFSEDIDEFADDETLRVAAHEAADLGLLASAVVPDPAFALDHFYQEQGIVHAFVVPGVETNESANGLLNSVNTITYGAQGLPIEESEDKNNDGIADSITTRQFDANGNVLLREDDDDADGTPDYVVARVFDLNGNRLSLSRDADGDGSADYVDSASYDSDGNLTTRNEDFDGDGVADTSYAYTYDLRGNRLGEQRDLDADGAVDVISEYSYDAADNLVSETIDADADGIPETLVTYFYDANGNQTGADYDLDADGIANETQRLYQWRVI